MHVTERLDATHPPMILYEYQNKRVTEKAFRKSLILKDAILVVLGWQRAELPV